MKELLRLLIKSRFRHNKNEAGKTTGGFTMIELLVGTIIAFLIIVPMLSFVVDTLNRDVKEQVKSNAEQELQAAVSYIQEDMSQAFYIYNDAGVAAIKNQLPTGDGKTPILVFWKREFLEEVVPVEGCPTTCKQDDTYVMSLVAYYKIEEKDKTSIWCQPSASSCPKRIARFKIRDGVRNTDDTYVCGTNGISGSCGTNDERKRDLGFQRFDGSNYTGWTKVTNETYTQDVIPLINYVQDFKLNQVSSTNDLAQITITGNAKRRIPGQFTDLECKDTSLYCPTATVQVGGRSIRGGN